MAAFLTGVVISPKFGSRGSLHFGSSSCWYRIKSWRLPQGSGGTGGIGDKLPIRMFSGSLGSTYGVIFVGFCPGYSRVICAAGSIFRSMTMMSVVAWFGEAKGQYLGPNL